MTEPLMTLMPDAARSARTQARCHQVLARRRRPPARSGAGPTAAADRLLTAGVCIAYLIGMARVLLALAAR